MTKRVVLSAVLGVFAAQCLLFAQDDPFTSKKAESGVGYPSFVKKVIRYSASAQRTLNRKIAELAREIKEKKSAKPLLAMLLVTFAYGVVHALGPGHGKTIATSYFLSEQGSIRKGIAAGLLIGFLHAFSALVLVLVMYFIIKQSFMGRIENVGRIVKLISYGLITAIGFWMLFKAMVDAWGKRMTQEKSRSNNGPGTVSIIPFAVAVGLTPCSGAIIMLLFSLSQGVLYLGIAGVFSMALGMAFTVSAVCIVTILAKKNLLRFTGRGARLSKALKACFSIVGALLVTLLGLLLFTGTL